MALRRVPVPLVPRIVRTAAFVEMLALAGIALAPPLVGLYAALLMIGGGSAGSVTGLDPRS